MLPNAAKTQLTENITKVWEQVEKILFAALVNLLFISDIFHYKEAQKNSRLSVTR